MVSNGVKAMHSLDNQVEIIDPAGSVIKQVSGSKLEVAREILAVIAGRLIR
jgi:phosphopantothenoylcysteine synthetase/decarboxylase